MRRPSSSLSMVTPFSVRSTIPRVERHPFYFLATDAASIERSVGTKHARRAGSSSARCITITTLWERVP